MTTITAVIIIIITIEVRKKEISSVKHKSIESEWVRERREVEEFHLKKGIEKKKNNDEKKEEEKEEEKAWNRNSILGQRTPLNYMWMVTIACCLLIFGDMESQIKIDSLQLNCLYVCSWVVGKHERE